MAIKYFDGKQWVDFASGERGPQGPAGPAGPQGQTGPAGATGNGISGVEWIGGTHSGGSSDTYRIRFTDGTAFDFPVYNGSDGQGAPGAMTPLPDRGEGSIGTANAYSREDHRHPCGITLIWENSSPSSSFAAQTLHNEKMDSYCMLLVILNSNGGTSAGDIVVYKDDLNVRASVPRTYSGSYVHYWRNIKFNGSGVVFGAGNRDGTETNASMVPFRIYGIK